MRGMFGLVGILVTVGVLVWVFSKTQVPVIQKGRNAQDQAAQIAGLDADRRPVGESITLAASPPGQKPYVEVVAIIAGGGMDLAYGLRPLDRIVAVGDVGFDAIGGAMPELVIDAYKGPKPLTILRNGQRLELPRDRNLALTPPTPAPQNPTPAPGTN